MNIRYFFSLLRAVLGTTELASFALLGLLVVMSSISQAVVVSSVPLVFSTLLSGEKASELFHLPLGLDLRLDTFGLSVTMFCIAIVATILALASVVYGNIIALGKIESISTNVLNIYLNKSYEWHLERNSSELVKRVFHDVNFVVSGVLQQLVQVIARLFDVLAIGIVLLVAKPKVAIVAGAILALIYGFLFLFVRRQITRLGKIGFQETSRRYLAANEALGNVKIVKIFDCDRSFLNRYTESTRNFTNATIKSSYLVSLPKPMLELVLYGGIFIGVALLSSQGWRAEAIFPLLSLYGVAGIRLLPAGQQIYISLSSIVSAMPMLEAVAKDLEPDEEDKRVSIAPTQGAQGIHFHHVNYSYPSTERPSLTDVSFSISYGQKVGIVGVTGAGKSTLVDLLLGLLKPSSGNIEFGQFPEDEFDTLLSYVPQNMTFIDASIRANIAIGVDEDRIDEERLLSAVEEAKILTLIQSLPEGFETVVGEEGVRLSGGQRQRIAIARALYRHPALLVLDEASSALDKKTEREIFEGLLANKKITLVAISHNLQILKECDQILLLQDGYLKSCGTFEELSQDSQMFRHLANLEGEFPSMDASVASGT